MTAINEFFKARKEAWLKKNTKASMDAVEMRALENECEQLFAANNWLPNAAKRAGQISISTHPCTFSHPSARKNKNDYTSSIIANGSKKHDGYLRSGNVVVEPDALGNAAALDVYKFLTLVTEDGQTLLHHIQQDSELARELLDIQSASYEELKIGFLAMVESKSDNVTSSKIKQIYFPVGNDYHQLSLLTASGLVFELRKRIDTLRFSDEAKAARACHREGKVYENGYKQINNLTTIGYGGTKPQNISVLNNQNGGKAHLLTSLPPVLKKREVQFPTVNFFKQSITPFHCKSLYYSLHSIYTNPKNNKEIRLDRLSLHQDIIIDKIIEFMVAARRVSSEQFHASTSKLSQSQKIWLVEEYKETRLEEDSWLDDIVLQATQFIFHGYKKVLKKRAITFGDGEYKSIYQQVIDSKEAFR